MEYRQALIDLEDAANHIHDGINAIGIMTMGLAQLQSPYAGGFSAVWHYLSQANQELQRQAESYLSTK